MSFYLIYRLHTQIVLLYYLSIDHRAALFYINLVVASATHTLLISEETTFMSDVLDLVDACDRWDGKEPQSVSELAADSGLPVSEVQAIVDNDQASDEPELTVHKVGGTTKYSVKTAGNEYSDN